MPPIRRSLKCDRCGLRYPKRKKHCVHCTGLSERQLQALKDRYNDEHVAHQKMAQIFILIAVLAFIAMLLLIL